MKAALEVLRQASTERHLSQDQEVLPLTADAAALPSTPPVAESVPDNGVGSAGQLSLVPESPWPSVPELAGPEDEAALTEPPTPTSPDSDIRTRPDVVGLALVIAIILAAAYLAWLWYGDTKVQPQAPVMHGSAGTEGRPASAATDAPPVALPPENKAEEAAGAQPGPLTSAPLPPAAASSVQAAIALPVNEEPASADPIRIQHGNTLPTLPSELVAADAALRAGRLDEAAKGYAKTLQADPLQQDALLGVASVALRKGRRDEAQAGFRQVLQLDPDNGTAQLGLAALDAAVDGNTEYSLRHHLDSVPNDVAALVTLADRQMTAGRWSEAQTLYFRAFGLSPSDPDLAFNLAVCLDHMGLARPAADYYRKALGLAETHPAQFDLEAVQHRLGELARNEPGQG